MEKLEGFPKEVEGTVGFLILRKGSMLAGLSHYINVLVFSN